jgi:hypothetical protein
LVEPTGIYLQRDEKNGICTNEDNVTVPVGIILTIKEGTRISIADKARISVSRCFG